MRVFDPLHSKMSDAASLPDRLAAAKIEGSVDGAEFLATEFHELSPSASFWGWKLAAILGAGRTTTPLGTSQVIEPLHDDAVDRPAAREALIACSREVGLWQIAQLARSAVGEPKTPARITGFSTTRLLRRLT
jgi:hypothetical protein